MLIPAVSLCLACLALLGLAAAPAHAAISSQDQQEIASLRRIFGIDPADASDEELAQLLDSPEVGAGLRGDVACAYLGEHALDGTAAEKVELQALLNEYSAVLAADQLLDPIALAIGGDSFAVEFLVGLHGALGELHSTISTFVDAEAYLESDNEYRSWLAQYYGFESDGKSAEEAREEVESTAGSALDAVTQPRHLSRDQLFTGYEYASGCMRLDANPEYRQGYANLIVGIVEQIRDYEGGKGLTLVPIAPGAVEAIDTGTAEVGEISLLDSGGGAVGGLGSLGAGDEAQILVSGAPAEVEFSLDGVKHLKADYSTLESPLFVGQPLATLADSPPMTGEFELDQGPFAASGSSPKYGWSFDGGPEASGTKATKTFSCYGSHTGTFMATAGEHTVKRTAQLDVPPPWNVHWTTSTGEDAVAPEVPIEFEADPSIPKGLRITWSFGDGHSAEGRKVKHTFESAGALSVTMYVEQPGCSSLTETRPFRVGRSTDWLSLSGSIGARKLTSSVAGYVIYGPTYIRKGQTLTVEPGANVKFVSTGLTEPGQLIVEGTLKVQGVAGAPAVFTSKYDDTAGGHCTCAPTGHVPAPGDWYGITLLRGGVASIEHADVRYAGPAFDLQGQGSHLTVSESLVSDSAVGIDSAAENDILAESSVFRRVDTGAVFECFGCTYTPRLRDLDFDEVTTGISAMGGSAPLVEGAAFAGAREDVVLTSTATRTRIRGTRAAGDGGYIHVYAGSLPTGVVRLESDLPYAVSGLLTVPTAGQLALAPGTVVKFPRNGFEPSELEVRGALVSSGTPARPVVLTSRSDDAAGGHCACAPAASSPARGDWWGVRLEGGASATLDHTAVRYAGADLELQPGASALVEGGGLTDAEDGLEATGPASLALANVDASRDNTGMRLECPSCSFVPHLTNVTFGSDSTAVTVTGAAAPRIRGSSFDAGGAWGVVNNGSVTVDARGNWWGAASGPAPGGAGAKVSGAVEYKPFCVAEGQCTAVSLSAADTTIAADGEAQTVLTATVSGLSGPVPGQHVYFASSDPGQSLGPVADNGDGTYTTTLTASHTVGEAQVRAVDASLEPAPSDAISLTQTPGTGPPLTAVIEEGSGTVISSPAGIECTGGAPTSCATEEIEEGTVILTASPASGYLFKNWKGCTSVQGRQCTVSLAEPGKTVGVKFTPAHAVTLKKAGTGLGSVGGVPCGDACIEATVSFVEGRAVKLKAKAYKTAEFEGWTIEGEPGACTGASVECVLTPTADTTVEADFTEKAKEALVVSKSGNGQGAVKSKPVGISCSYTCSSTTALYYKGEHAELTETVQLGKGSAFVEWTGGTGSAASCNGSASPTCSFTIEAGSSIQAKFE
jgi:hypothetical protein